MKFCDECCGIYREEERRQEMKKRIRTLQRKCGMFDTGRFLKCRKKQPVKNYILSDVHHRIHLTL
jgi:hypothetical protein